MSDTPHEPNPESAPTEHEPIVSSNTEEAVASSLSEFKRVKVEVEMAPKPTIAEAIDKVPDEPTDKVFNDKLLAALNGWFISVANSFPSPAEKAVILNVRTQIVSLHDLILEAMKDK